MNELCKFCEMSPCQKPCAESLEIIEKAERLKGEYKPRGIGRILTQAEKNRVLAKGLRV